MTAPSCPHCGGRPAESAMVCRCGAPIGEIRAGSLAEEEHPAERAEPLDALGERLQELTGDEYDILGRLGRGGMASVYLAVDRALRREVAIKVLSDLHLGNPEMVTRFEREARTIAKLDHPHIVQVHGVRHHPGLHFLVLQFIRGLPLTDLLGSPVPVSAVAKWFGQVADALDYSHREGVIHRDVTPGNVLVKRTGHAVVTDFGIAKVLQGPELTRTGLAMGTLTYMSPEQLGNAAAVGPATDQYSLGILLFHLLSGRKPFSTDSLGQALASRRTPPRVREELDSDVPDAFVEAIQGMLSYRPEDRFETVSDAARAAGCLAGEPSDPTIPRTLEISPGTEDADGSSGLDSVDSGRATADSPPLTPSGGATEQAVPTENGPASDWSRSNRTGWIAGLSVGGTAVALLLVLLAGPWRDGVSPPPGGVDGSGPERGGSEAEAIGAALPSLFVFEPGTVQVGIGESQTVAAQALSGDGGSEVDGVAFEWRALNPGRATVDPEGRTATIAGVAAGPTEIRVSGGGHVQELPVTVVPEAVGSIRIGGSDTVELVPDSFRELTAVAAGARSDRALDRVILWTVERPEVASVSEGGRVTGIAPGRTYLEARAGGRSDSLLIVVREPVGSVLIEGPGSRTLPPDSSLRLEAGVFDAGSGARLQRDVTWRSSRPGVASVDAGGRVSAVGPGTSTITAEAGGRVDTVSLSVEAPTEPTPTLSVSILGSEIRLLGSNGREGVSSTFALRAEGGRPSIWCAQASYAADGATSGRIVGPPRNVEVNRGESTTVVDSTAWEAFGFAERGALEKRIAPELLIWETSCSARAEDEEPDRRIPAGGACFVRYPNLSWAARDDACRG